VHVQPLVLDLLLHLVVHRDRVIGHQELLDQVWLGSVVGTAAVYSAVRDARTAVGDDGRRQAIIETVPRQGFRLACAVEEHGVTPAGSTSRTWESDAPLTSRRHRCETLLELARHRVAAGGSDDGMRELVVKAADLARESGWPTLLAQAALLLADPSRGVALGDPTTISLLEEARSRLGSTDDALAARVDARLAAERGSPLPTRSAADEVRRREPPRARIEAKRAEAERLLAELFAHSGPDASSSRRRCAAELVRVARAGGDATLEVWGHQQLVECAIESADLKALETAIADFAKTAERSVGSPHLELLTAMDLGRATREGRFEEADSLYACLVRLADDSPLALLRLNVEILAICLDEQRGRPIDPARLAALLDIPTSPDYTLALRIVVAVTALNAGHGPADEIATDDLFTAPVPQNMLTLSLLFGLGQLAAARGDPGRAAEISARLEPYADRVASSAGMHYHGSMWRPLGNLARVCGRPEQAVVYLERAVRVETQMKAICAATATRLDLAVALAGAGRRPDAFVVLHACIDTARRLGLHTLELRGEALHAQLQRDAREHAIAEQSRADRSATPDGARRPGPPTSAPR